MTDEPTTTHYHAPCYACGGRGMHGEPNGPAFPTEEEARIFADRENNEPYMQSFGSHHHTVESCTGEFCLQLQDRR